MTKIPTHTYVFFSPSLVCQTLSGIFKEIVGTFFFGKHMCVFVSLFLASPFYKKPNASVTFFGYFPSPALLGPKDLEDSARIQGDWMLELGKKLLFPTHFTVSHEFTFPHLYLSFPRFSNKVSLCFSSPPSASHCARKAETQLLQLEQKCWRCCRAVWK